MFDIFSTLFRFKEKESPDELGAFPVKVNVDAFPERRYLWTSRFLVILTSVSVCINMILVLTIYLMIPSIKVRPTFFNINKYFSDIEMVQPREIHYPVSDLITEEYIKEYLYLRYTMTSDAEELINRWRTGSKLYWLSTPEVYAAFQSGEMSTNIKLFKKGMQRYIEIAWIRPLLRGLWQAQITTYDMMPGEEPVVTYWRATMRVVYGKLTFADKEDKSFNPYGFLIESYSLAYHGTKGNVESYIDTARRQAESKKQ